MAWYPREFVERVKLIKQLQEERFLPLKVIREVLEQDGSGLEGRSGCARWSSSRTGSSSGHCRGQRRQGHERSEVQRRYGVPPEALERLESSGC